MPNPRIPLAQRITTRDGTLSKDSLMQNMFREEQPDKVEAVKRPGLTTQIQLPAGAAQGAFNLAGIGYAIVADVAYNITTGAAFTIPAVTIAGLQYDCIPDVTFGAATITQVKSTAGLWTFDGAAFTKVVSANYPATTVRGMVLLDGTTYVMTPSGIIQGSALQDPTTWSALNFIGTSQSLGTGLSLFMHLNYAFAFNNLGLQGFYDNGNPPPGSPLSPAGNAAYRIGCASGDSLASCEDMTVFMSKTLQKGRSIGALQGLSLVTLSSPYIDRILNRSNLTQVWAFCVKTVGHSFYVLTLGDLGVTLVCDLLSKDWDIWTSTVAGAQAAFQYRSYLNNSGLDLLQHLTSGAVVAVDPTATQDAGSTISCRIRTVPLDFQTARTKIFIALNLIGDTVTTNVSVRYTDDDYQTWSSYRAVDMSTTRKQLRGLGKSRRRAFELLHEDATALRLEAMEPDVLSGTS